MKSFLTRNRDEKIFTRIFTADNRKNKKRCHEIDALVGLTSFSVFNVAFIVGIVLKSV